MVRRHAKREIGNMKSNKNVILIGMPACGKSTIGVVLAKVMGKAFVDTDLLIQQAEGTTLQEIIDTKGNEYFAEVEDRVLQEFDEENYIVATGGSAVYCDAAMKKFKEKGVVVYLRVALEDVLKRLHNLETRGVTLKEGQTLEDLYYERTPLYEKYADVIMDEEGYDIWPLAEELAKRLYARDEEK